MRMPAIIRGLLATTLALSASLSAAQDWPAKPIRFINPFGAGGLLDAVLAATRIPLETRLKQPIHLENRPGGGGLVGMQTIALAAPDGYTFGFVPSNTMVINQFLFRSNLDPLKEFVPVSVIVDVPLFFAVSSKNPARTLEQFFAEMRARPGQLNFASPGLGTPPHLAAEMVIRTMGLSAVHVPYKGGHDSTFALSTNEVQFMVIAQASLAGQLAAGAVRPLAVGAQQRVESLPEVPTFEQAGYPQIQKVMPRSWWGVIAPKGTPAAIVNRFADEFRQVLNEPEAQRRLRSVGLEPVGSSPAQFAAQLPDEAQRWSDLIRDMGLKAQ